MKIEKWIKNNCTDLSGKLVAITGASGDLGYEVCKILVELNANLLLINRNREKTELLIQKLQQLNDKVSLKSIIIDLEQFNDVEKNMNLLLLYEIDFLILNAGAYKIPRKTTDKDFDNVFQINFVSQYYIARKLIEANKVNKIIAVSSIAYNYSKTNMADIDFAHINNCSKVYGNSKRFLMASLYELININNEVNLAIVHPGISLTNITSHYPKILFLVMKYPMKLIFSKPKKAALSIVKGIYENCDYYEWIGPKYFDIWGYPYRRKVNKININESKNIHEKSCDIYKSINVNNDY